MAGAKGRSGGARGGAGRKADREVQELRATLAEALPENDRQDIFKKMAVLAKAGDVQAAKLILAYSYGTPPSGDEIKIREQVGAQLDAIKEKIVRKLGPARAREIFDLLATPDDADDGGDSA